MRSISAAIALLAVSAVSCEALPETAETAEVATTADARVSTFLMFQDGRAEEAMDFYVSLFEGAEIVRLKKYGPDEAGQEGSVKVGIFEMSGHRMMCTDATMKADFDFSPATSIFVDCIDDAEIERLAEQLADGGMTMMPLDAYEFSDRFAWVQDRYGISWQLSVNLH